MRIIKRQKGKKGQSTRDLLGVQTFTRYGLATGKGELLFFLAAPTNISVLSSANIAVKVRHLMMVLSALPNIEITCTDACQCFDGNKAYLQGRLQEEASPQVRHILRQDLEMLTELQAEMSSARQFLFLGRCCGMKPEQVFQTANRMEKRISEQGFEVRRMGKSEIKQLLAAYFGASMDGGQLPDVDGAQFLELGGDLK